MDGRDIRRTAQHPVRLEQLAQRAAEQAHERLQKAAAVLAEMRDEPPKPGDLWVFPALAGSSGEELGDPGDGLEEAVEWALLEVDEERGLYLVPVDGSPFLGTADVEAPDGRVLRCGLDVWLESKVMVGASRTGLLEATTLSTAQQRCRDLKVGQAHGTLDAVEMDRDPEYRQFLRGLRMARSALQQRFEVEEQGRTPILASSGLAVPASRQAPSLQLGEGRRRPRNWRLPATLAASLLFAVLLTVLGVQWRTLEALRRDQRAPIADPPVVWLEPVGERGQSEAQTFVLGARYVVLLMSPQVVGPAPDDYRLEIMTTGDEERSLWSGELSPGQQPELFVLVPGDLLEAGEYRLLLTGRRGEEESPAGRFRLRVRESPAAPSSGD